MKICPLILNLCNSHLGLLLTCFAGIPLGVFGKKVNEGTNYEYDDEDRVIYKQLGESCDPAIQGQNGRKTGLCRATLYCDSKRRTCDCADVGPYKYVAENGKCKNYVGSACYADVNAPTGNCVMGAQCKSGRCVCNPGKRCVDKKVPVRKRREGQGSGSGRPKRKPRY